MLPRDFPEPHASRHFALVLFLPLRNCQRPNVYHVGILQGAVCSGCAVAFRSVSHLSSSLKMEAPFPRKLRTRGTATDTHKHQDAPLPDGSQLK